jgi:hypothetical protein
MLRKPSAAHSSVRTASRQASGVPLICCADATTKLFRAVSSSVTVPWRRPRLAGATGPVAERGTPCRVRAWLPATGPGRRLRRREGEGFGRSSGGAEEGFAGAGDEQGGDSGERPRRVDERQIVTARGLPHGMDGARWAANFLERYRGETVLLSPPQPVQRALIALLARDVSFLDAGPRSRRPGRGDRRSHGRARYDRPGSGGSGWTLP